MPRRNAIFDILDEWGDTGDYESAYQQIQREYRIYMPTNSRRGIPQIRTGKRPTRKPTRKQAIKRKKSKWQIFMGQKKNQIKLRNGKLNLKKMGVAYRKKNKK